MTEQELKLLMEMMTAVLWMAVPSPSLRIFARPRYPQRELGARVNPNGSATFTLYLFGWHYKYHGRKPPKPRMDLRAIKTDLNEFLGPKFMVSEVYDRDTHAELTIWRIQ